ncbi:phosphate ABC transporter substrate-binding protein [Desulfallas thermosapovorans]|uniref:Phosphate-binding protein n=1 Tax=Desulfallas thermosapovorans DSM 6562 TaxID=1121431 RepID=A0A5S4ZPJ4_9FIRM|nr:phosphate ABC transporter substrate-binding protein [Desulfallas thermosapovorans]TYO94619.1 phosphate ABC transporter substrate-binding protein (PhoT family) [Desulfallas thermosapovorans DSM 6562]
MFKKLLRASWLLVVLILAAAMASGCGGGSNAGNVQQNDAALSGSLQINGSTTVTPIAQGWAEAFHEIHPEAEVIISGTGSGNGIAALINGTTEIAMASREIKDSEREQIDGEVKEYVVGYDALAVIIHPDNPVKTLSLAQLKDIFTGKITNWKDVGGDDAEILVYTRDSSSGTYEFFKEHVLENEEFAAGARKTASNAAMVNSIAQEETAIGYCGLAFVNSSVKAVPVSAEDGSPVEPTLETAKSKEYPIVRNLNMYTAGEARGVAKAYLDYGFSAEGQAIVEEAGYIPVK